MPKQGIFRADYGWHSRAYRRAEKRTRVLGPSALRSKMKKAMHRRLRRVAKQALLKQKSEP